MRPFPHSPPLNPSPPSSLQARVRLLTLVPAPAVSRVHLVRLASSYQFRIPKAARGWAGQLFHPSIPPSCLLPSRLNDPSPTLPAAKLESYFPPSSPYQNMAKLHFPLRFVRPVVYVFLMVMKGAGALISVVTRNAALGS